MSIGALTGYRTIITNVIIVLAAAASVFGIIIPEDEKTAVIAGLIAVANIALRIITRTPVGGAST